MFSDLTKLAALQRAGGRCECTRSGHSHVYRCPHGVSSGIAHFHHKAATVVGGSDGLSNCEVLCVTCHRQTPSYGRH